MSKRQGIAHQPDERLPSQRKDGQLRANAREADARFSAFGEKYVELRGNAYRAALEAGYPEAYAKGSAWKLAARLKLRTQPVLRRDNLDEVFVARKLKRLSNAKMPKWNQLSKQWDYFEDAATQLRALELVVDLLGMKPPTRLKGEGPAATIPVTIVSSIARPSGHRRAQQLDESTDW